MKWRIGGGLALGVGLMVARDRSALPWAVLILAAGAAVDSLLNWLADKRRLERAKRVDAEVAKHGYRELLRLKR